VVDRSQPVNLWGALVESPSGAHRFDPLLRRACERAPVPDLMKP
jgi:hypothetical protein